MCKKNNSRGVSYDFFHEMSKSIFCENKKKYFTLSSAEIFTQNAKH